MEDNILAKQARKTEELSDDEAGDDNGNNDEDTISRSRGTLNGIPGEQGHNAVRVMEGDRVNRASTPWPGSHANCNSVPGRGHAGRSAESPDSVVKSPFSTLDSRSTGDGSALGPGVATLEGYHGRGNTFNLDNTLLKTRVGFDFARRDQGEIHRASEDEEEEEDDLDEVQQPLVEGKNSTIFFFFAFIFQTLLFRLKVHSQG